MDTREDIPLSSSVFKVLIGSCSVYILTRLLRHRIDHSHPSTPRPELNLNTNKSNLNSTVKESTHEFSTPIKHTHGSSLKPSNEPSDEPSDELKAKVIKAAQETAYAFCTMSEDFMLKRNLVKYCYSFGDTVEENKKRFVEVLASRPELGTCRVVSMSGYIHDGGTPLHVAARSGNTAAMEVLLTGSGWGGDEHKACPWTVDVQGRLPLHLAAEHYKVDACRMLCHHMTSASAIIPCGSTTHKMDVPQCRETSIRGQNAPVDITGTTPLGWASRNPSSPRPPDELIELLYSRGDKSVLPITPYTARSGRRRGFRVSSHSPLVSSAFVGHNSRNTDSNSLSSLDEDCDDFYGSVYAHSDAKGWRETMEDAIIAECPLSATCSDKWSCFAVLDGHGGSFASEYVASRLPRILAEKLDDLLLPSLEHNLDTPSSRCSVDPVSITGGRLETLLIEACTKTNQELSGIPKMTVTVHERCSNKKRVDVDNSQSRYELRSADTSGTTVCLCLMGPGLMAIANVGDSRAVICVESPSKTRGALAEELSEDHTVSVEEKKDVIDLELKRIEAANLNVPLRTLSASQGVTPKIYSPFTVFKETCLAPSRSIGDFQMKWGIDVDSLPEEERTEEALRGMAPVYLPDEKQGVTCVPDVLVRQRSKR